MILVVRHDGMLAADIRPLVRLNVNVIVEHQGRREQGVRGGWTLWLSWFQDDERALGYAREAVRLGLVNLEAVDPLLVRCQWFWGLVGQGYCCTKPLAMGWKEISIANGRRLLPIGSVIRSPRPVLPWLTMGLCRIVVVR
ncbi:MAG: hypothetical protein Ct9H300mP13_6700 [Gammaproteobacteria bacterium]|nr:MAG: hypothetical protein Ct9H300mP13_6700 [Gammaproteobacteria bacterium]